MEDEEFIYTKDPVFCWALIAFMIGCIAGLTIILVWSAISIFI